MSDEDTMLCQNTQSQVELGEVCSQILQLMGEVLTIVDASIGDKQQNKAVKDLIKARFYARNGKITRETYDREGIDWEKATTPPDDFDPEKDGVTEKEMVEMAGADSAHL